MGAQPRQTCAKEVEGARPRERSANARGASEVGAQPRRMLEKEAAALLRSTCRVEAARTPLMLGEEAAAARP